MLEFFPKLEGRIKDTGEKESTLRQMLQMHAGYP